MIIVHQIQKNSFNIYSCRIVLHNMVNSSNKTRRLNKNYFRIKGKPDLYIKDEVIVNFTPLRKKYILHHTERVKKATPYYLCSTQIANITPYPFDFPQHNKKIKIY